MRASIRRFSVPLLVSLTAACGTGSRSTTGPGSPSRTAAHLARISSDSQTGTIDSALAAPLTVRVTDSAGHALAGVTVSWTLVGRDALNAPSSVSDTTGEASVRVTLGAAVDTSLIAAHVSGVRDTVRFVAIASAAHVRDDWPTYGHDARRSSASLATVPGALAVAWRYDPSASAPANFVGTLDALATTDGVVLEWTGLSTHGYSEAPLVDRVSPTGTGMWSFVGGYDYTRGTSGSIWGTNFVLNDDGLGYINLATGTLNGVLPYDSWGETLVDSSGLYLSNDIQIDGPPIYVGALSAPRTVTWTANTQGSVKGTQTSTSGMALSRGVLFYAVEYESTPALPFGSGVYALSAGSGQKVAYAATVPSSHISADSARVFLIENGNALVARSQSDLHVVWSASVASPGQQSPVVAAGLVIIATTSDIEAFRATTGARVWRAPVTGATAAFNAIPNVVSTMAAALGSGTLVVTSAADGLHVLSLADGHSIWQGLAPVSGSVIRNPVLVNDPASGTTVYVIDSRGLVALKAAP